MLTDDVLNAATKGNDWFESYVVLRETLQSSADRNRHNQDRLVYFRIIYILDFADVCCSLGSLQPQQALLCKKISIYFIRLVLIIIICF